MKCVGDFYFCWNASLIAEWMQWSFERNSFNSLIIQQNSKLQRKVFQLLPIEHIRPMTVIAVCQRIVSLHFDHYVDHVHFDMRVRLRVLPKSGAKAKQQIPIASVANNRTTADRRRISPTILMMTEPVLTIRWRAHDIVNIKWLFSTKNSAMMMQMQRYRCRWISADN